MYHLNCIAPSIAMMFPPPTIAPIKTMIHTILKLSGVLENSDINAPMRVIIPPIIIIVRNIRINVLPKIWNSGKINISMNP